ncbi:hypothetical protein DKP76_13480 [Falsochrobactrum shanghaiense]|uniref:Uncharacterized protein n=1 Tax=Falsochrobactrum shanghaiense TaxID=2201899 RepID=A0A316J5U6_9HYPH|nr:hypothetical protein [Falsochrobactrum shanghaiense]PWL17044.1 hypothetical protein DKP76_13480 [Falsochrobactrum shanghaiense]
MNEERRLYLIASIMEALAEQKASDEEIKLLFDEPELLCSTIIIGKAIISTSRKAAEKVASEIVSEAREVWGDEAASELILTLGVKGVTQ